MSPPRGLLAADSRLNDIPPSAESGHPVGNDLTDAHDEIYLFRQSIDENGSPSLCFSQIGELGGVPPVVIENGISFGKVLAKLFFYLLLGHRPVSPQGA